MHHIDDLPYDPKDNFSINYGGFRLKHQNVINRALMPVPSKDKLPPVASKSHDDIFKRAITFMPDLKDDFKFSEEELK